MLYGSVLFVNAICVLTNVFYPYRAMRDFKFDDSSKNRCKSGRK